MKYSIITINYNNSKGLEDTIKSVISQEYKDYEFIIIDGGSNDDSVNIIKKYRDKITYWISEPDRGIYHAMNKGVLQSKGEYLNFMNSGDCFYKKDILHQVSFMPNQDIIIGNSITTKGNIFGPHMPITLYHLCIYGFNHQAVFYKRSLFAKYMYDETLKFLSDFKLTIQCLINENCSFYFTPMIIAKYDLSGISSTNPIQRNAERDDILRSLLPPRIADDYIFFSQLKSPILYDIPYLTKTYRLHKFIYRISHSFIRIHNFFANFFSKSKNRSCLF